MSVFFDYNIAVTHLLQPVLILHDGRKSLKIIFPPILFHLHIIPHCMIARGSFYSYQHTS